MTYTPARIGISNITQALPAVVTTSSDHNLTSGQVVRVNVPKNYGMIEISGKLYIITILSPTTFSLQYSQIPPAINVDSRSFTAFTTPSAPQFTAEVLAVGSGPSPIVGPDPLVSFGVCASAIADGTANIATTNQPF